MTVITLFIAGNWGVKPIFGPILQLVQQISFTLSLRRNQGDSIANYRRPALVSSPPDSSSLAKSVRHEQPIWGPSKSPGAHFLPCASFRGEKCRYADKAPWNNGRSRIRPIVFEKSEVEWIFSHWICPWEDFICLRTLWNARFPPLLHLLPLFHGSLETVFRHDTFKTKDIACWK